MHTILYYYNVGFEVIMPLQQVECSGIEQTSI